MEAKHPALWYRHGDTADAATDYRSLATAPALATDGVPVPPDFRDLTCTLDIQHTAAGARSFTVVIWGYKPAGVKIWVAGAWVTIPAAGGHQAGWTVIGTIDVNEAANGREAHQVEGASTFAAVAAQITSAVGAPSVWTDFGFSRQQEE